MPDAPVDLAVLDIFRDRARGKMQGRTGRWGGVGYDGVGWHGMAWVGLGGNLMTVDSVNAGRHIRRCRQTPFACGRRVCGPFFLHAS